MKVFCFSHISKRLDGVWAVSQRLWAGICLLMTCLSAHALMPPADEPLTVQAQATYFLSGSFLREVVRSNIVEVRVSPVALLRLEGNAQMVTQAGVRQVIAYRAFNPGNVRLSLDISASNVTSCAGKTATMDLGNPRAFVDSNGNGVVDPQETSTRLILEPGQGASLLGVGEVPFVKEGGACVELRAVDAARGLSQTFRTFLSVADAPVIELLKQGQASQALRPGSGDRAVYTVTGRNLGVREAVMADRGVSGQTITVNGQPMRALVLRDLIPEYAVYQGSSLKASHSSASLLFRQAGDAPYAYRTQDPGASTIEVAAAFPFNLPPGQAISLSFEVSAATGASGPLSNVAQFEYCEGACAAGTQSISSNLSLVPVEAHGLGLALREQARKINTRVLTQEVGGVKTVLTQPDDTVTYTLALRVRNQGRSSLFNLQVPQQLSGSSLLGSYTSAEVPGPGQYTVVAGSLRVAERINSATVVPLNTAFTGDGGQTGLLMAGLNGSVLPPSGEFVLQYQVRVNVSGRAGASVSTQVRAQASLHAQSVRDDVADSSTDGSNPDPDGDLNASNNSAPTVLTFPDVDALKRLSAGLFISKEVVQSTRVSQGVYDLSYRIKVANRSNVDIRFVRVIDNLTCAFTVPTSLGQINVSNWTFVERPRAKNNVLPVSSAFTGDAPCDGDAQSANDPSQAPTDPRVLINDSRYALAAGAEEEFTFSVRVSQGSSEKRSELANKAWLLAVQDNNLGEPNVLAASASVTTTLVDPQGYVYDSLSRRPVAGARVILSRLSCERSQAGPIRSQELLNGDNFTYDAAQGTVSMLTGADGRYQFFWKVPEVSDLCTYAIRVEPPAGYRASLLWPPEAGVYTGCGAVVPDDGIPQGDGVRSSWYERVLSGYQSGRRVNGVLQETCDVLHNHIPLDPDSLYAALLLSKKANKTQVEFGEFIDYEVTLSNRSGLTASRLAIEDVLPPGFSYVPGSSRLGSERLADPVIRVDPQTRRASLSYDLGTRTLEDKAALVLRYRLRVGVGAMLEADATNAAVASAALRLDAATRLRSNVAQARVRVNGGVLGTRGFAVGKVWADCNRNGLQDGEEEPGIPGVRLYMEDGTSVITDAFGRWSLYGLKPVTHVLRVDLSTLPAGSELAVLDNRQVGQAHSRFLDLKNGELVRADFAVQGCKASDLGVQIEQRKKVFAQAVDQQLQALVSARLPTEIRSLTTSLDSRSQPASGVVAGSPGFGTAGVSPAAPDQALIVMPQGLPASPGQSFAPTTAPVSRPAEAGRPASPSLSEALLGPIATFSDQPLEDVLADLPARAGFVELKEGDTVVSNQINVRVTGPAQTTLRLLVNHRPVNDNRIGKRATVTQNGLVAYEYIGVTLQDGLNVLEVQASDAFGNVRETARIQITAPGSLARARLVPQGRLQADPLRPATLKLQLSDERGVPITARTSVTLEIQGAQWITPDLNPREPGHQVMMEGGELLLQMQPPAQPGSVAVRIQAGPLLHHETLTFLPALTPLQGIGIVEGVLDLGRQGRLVLGQPNAANAFEQELTGLVSQGEDHKVTGRTAFFFKGTIRGDYLLTAALDSDKQDRERAFRDIRPDEFYPVYGDASIRGFDAQSAGKLYVRIDKNRSFLLLGDFNTASSAEVRQLSQYGRSVSGVQHRYQDDKLRVTSFHAQTNATQKIEDVPANGLSFYTLAITAGEIRPGSERVELQVRDRRQPSLVLQSRTLTAMVDYSFEPLTRRLILAQPLPTFDAELNPQFLRVTYEIESGGPTYSVVGTDVQFAVTEQLQIGVAAVRDDNPQNPRDLRAATALARVGPGTTVSAELVQTETTLRGQGQAARLSAQHAQGAVRLQAQVQQTDRDFDNLGSTPGVARTEANTSAEYALSTDTRLRLQARHSREDSDAGNQTPANSSGATAPGLRPGKQSGLAVALAHKFSEQLAAEVGLQQGNPAGVGGVGFSAIQSGGAVGGASSTSALSLTGQSQANSNTSARLRLTSRPSQINGLQVFGEVLQDLDESQRRTLTLGADYALNSKVRVYAQHALASGLDPVGQTASVNGYQLRQATVLGLDSAYVDGGRFFNELRLPSQAQAQNATGVRHTFKLGEHWRLNVGAERVQAVGGAPATQGGSVSATNASTSSTAVSLGADWAQGPWRLSGAAEQREAASGDSSLFSLAGAWRLNNDLTLLARVTSTSTSSSNGAHNEQQRQQIGMAWRPAHADAWNVLGQYEHRKQDVSAGSSAAASAPANTSVGVSESHMASAHANWRISRQQALSLRYAVKYSELTDTAVQSSYWAQLAHARYTHDLTDTWDVGLQAGLMWGKGGAQQSTLGLETGYRLAPGLWLSVGHNLLGLREPDLAGLNYTSRGSYVRLRWKFDEAVLQFGRVAERPGVAGAASPAASRLAAATVPPSSPPAPESTAVPAAPASAQAPEPQPSEVTQPPTASVAQAADPLPPLPEGPRLTLTQEPAIGPLRAQASEGPSTEASPQRYDLLVPTRVDDFEELVERVHAWAAAWMDKDLAAYFQHYAADFKPGLMSRDQWLAQRQRMLSRPGAIDVQIGPIEIRPQRDGTVLTVFSQRYQSEQFRDRVSKMLRWSRVGERWVIVQESNR